MRLLIAPLLCLLCCACSDSTNEPTAVTTTEENGSGATDPRVFRGTLALGFERSVFVPEGEDVAYWATGDFGEIANAPIGGNQDQTFVVVLEGTLSEPGHYGHLGGYERELRISKVRSQEPIQGER